MGADFVCRRGLLTWIEAGGSSEVSAGAVLESIIRVLTSKGRLGKAASMDDVGCARVWGSLPFVGCVGRLCPDTEVASFKASVKAAGEGRNSFEEWMRITTTAAVETEINIQVGTYSLKSNGPVFPLILDPVLNKPNPKTSTSNRIKF